jgi:hypothetical protein
MYGLVDLPGFCLPHLNEDIVSEAHSATPKFLDDDGHKDYDYG